MVDVVGSDDTRGHDVHVHDDDDADASALSEPLLRAAALALLHSSYVLNSLVRFSARRETDEVAARASFSIEGVSATPAAAAVPSRVPF